MSLDRSLESANSLVRHRNVLTRTERLEKLTEQEKWNDSKSVFGLPKVTRPPVMETACSWLPVASTIGVPEPVT